MPNSVMYIFVNKGLGMSPGKIGAQTGHAAVEAYNLSNQYLASHWLDSGYTKLVMEARDTEHMYNIKEYLADKGFQTAPIIDEGRTETAPHSFTAMGVEIVDKEVEKVAFVFGDFDLYRASHWTELAAEVKSRQSSRWKRLKEVW